MFLYELGNCHYFAMSYLLHVCKVCIAREEDVSVGYYGQFQKEIVLGVTAAL